MSKPRGGRATWFLAVAAASLGALIVSSAAHAAMLGARPYAAIKALLEPFGTGGETLHHGGLTHNWRVVSKSLAAEHKILARCRDDLDSCPNEAKRFLALIEKALRRDGRTRIAEINRAINLSIRPAEDRTQFGVEEFWASPLTTFASGAGDCEDYAIAKYAALREMGFASEDLRLVVVRDNSARDFHAVAAVRHEGRWLILDNRTPAIREDAEIAHFDPLFVLEAGSVRPLVAAPAKTPAPAQDNPRTADIADEAPTSPMFHGSSLPVLL